MLIDSKTENIDDLMTSQLKRQQSIKNQCLKEMVAEIALIQDMSLFGFYELFMNEQFYKYTMTVNIGNIKVTNKLKDSTSFYALHRGRQPQTTYRKQSAELAARPSDSVGLVLIAGKTVSGPANSDSDKSGETSSLFRN